MDSLLVDWKLSVLSYFLHGTLVLKYADSSDQRDFFLHGSFVLEICLIKSVEYGWLHKNLRNKSKLFLKVLFLPRICF